MIKIVIAVVLLLIFISLFSALYYLMKGDTTEKTVRALTWRIGLSLALFLVLMIAFSTGIIGPPNVHP